VLVLALGSEPAGGGFVRVCWKLRLWDWIWTGTRTRRNVEMGPSYSRWEGFSSLMGIGCCGLESEV